MMRVVKFIAKLLLAIVVGSLIVIGAIAAVSITLHASPAMKENIFFAGAIVAVICIGCAVVFGDTRS